MALNVRNYNNKEMLLFPASIGDYLPQDHLAWVIDEVVEQLDLQCLYKKIPSVGNPSYHPKMMLKLLFYGYAASIFSSRRIANALESDVAFIFLSGMQKPDFRTISDFRKNNLKELSEMFVQIVRLCRQLGLVELGHISLDSTVIGASANGGRFYDKDQLTKEEQKIQDQIQKLLDTANKTDTKEDELYGPDIRGDELPKELSSRKKRLEKIQEAKSKLEEGSIKKLSLTDTDASYQKLKSGLVKAGYRAEASIDSKHQIITACDVTNDRTDNYQLLPLIEQTEENLPEVTEQPSVIISADSGYSSMDRLKELEEKPHIDAYIPDVIYQGKARGKKVSEDSPFHKIHFRYNKKKDVYICPEGKELSCSGRRQDEGGQWGSTYKCRQCRQCPQFGVCTINRRGRQIFCYDNADVLLRMRQKLDTEKGKEIYRRRKVIVEPVFGNIKQNLGFWAFRLRGLTKVKAEFTLISIAHNIRKMAKHLRQEPLLNLPRGDFVLQPAVGLAV